MKEEELEYLRFFYSHVNLGEHGEDAKLFINSQYESTGRSVPEKYDIYTE